MTLSVVVLISGAGSNLAAIGSAIDAQRCDARVAAVISDRASASGLGWAQQRGIPTDCVRPKDFDQRERWDTALVRAIEAHRPQLLVLAGFMRIVGASVLQRYPGLIINVHPSLLPLFPGADAPAQAIAARVRVSGCSVHVVDGGIDSGPIIAQGAVPVLPEDDAASLHRRIQAAEHRLLPAVIDAIARGVIELAPQLRIDSARFAPDGMLVSPVIVPD